MGFMEGAVAQWQSSCLHAEDSMFSLWKLLFRELGKHIFPYTAEPPPGRTDKLAGLVIYTAVWYIKWYSSGGQHGTHVPTDIFPVLTQCFKKWVGLDGAYPQKASDWPPEIRLVEQIF